ncbi:Imm52 family immunity protein [Streptomyces sp. NPDC059255]|uniref:Imm52 family immunity protein n=1 Tax=Streptomyces sp. NPDC059255 TaxID=3346793 RepID=UPI00369DC29F
MRRLVRGFWGRREESAEALAARWKLTLDRLAGLLPAAGAGPGVWRNISASGPATGLRPDAAALLAALRVAREADGWSDRTGYGLRLVAAGAPGWKIEVSGRAGGAPENLLQSMVIGVDSPDGAEIPDAELLAAVAEVWEPDFGGVTDDDVLDVLEDDGGFVVGEPAIGWVGYLSPARAALVPDDMAEDRKELGVGGVLLDITSRGDTEAVLRAYLRLRDAGALQPLPRPLDRATL